MRARPRARSPETHLPPPAKLSPPRLSSVVARPRLFKLLDQAARRPVVWVEGPAGSGKTTLAASWLARRRVRTLWYQVDARDRDPATFFYYLREAVRRLAPRRREPLRLLTPEYLACVETYARNFFDGVFERLGAPGALVLDDFQELPEGAALRRILAAVLAAIPEGVHVVVLSRAAPPPELARLRANSVVATLGWDALRFTPREATALLAEHGLPRPGSGAFAGLYEEADGWAAGLVLLGEAERQRGRRREDGEHRRTAELYAYFAKELFERADPATQRVLLATACLPAVPARIAEQLAGPGAADLLDRLARDDFFTTRRGGGEPVYQYHPLFRAFLRARAEAAVAPDERAALQRRAARLLDEAGQPEDALALLQEAGDGAAASAVVLRLAPILQAQGRLQTLEAAIRALPEDRRDAEPWLLQWLGVCRMFHASPESLALHERAFAAFQARGDDAGSLAAWAGAVKAMFFASRDFAAVGPWVRWLEARMRRAPEPSADDLPLDVSATMLECLTWSEPDHPDLPVWAARVAAAVRTVENPDVRARALVPVGWYRLWTGDLAEVAFAVEEIQRACRAPGVRPANRIMGLGLLASAANYVTCDPERALVHAGEALRLADAEGVHAHDHWVHAIAAFAHLTRRDTDGARVHLEAIRRTSDARVLATSGLHLQAAAWRALLLDDVGGALALTERAQRAVEKGGFTLERAQVNFQLAQLHRARGDAPAAERHLAVAEETAAAARTAPFAWACRLMRAQLALDAGRRDAGRALLASALAEGRERGFTKVPAWSTALAVAGLCEEALEAGIEVEYVRSLIRLHDLALDPARCSAGRWPFALRVTALGPFALHGAHGRTLARGAARSKPLELLKALVVLGGREVPEARVVELLWPDAEGDRGRQRLKFTLHALRRVLGREDVLTLEKGLLSLDPRRVGVDLWELERQLARLASAVEGGREGEAADALGRVIALHRGPLLQGEAAAWAVPARDRLEAKVRRLVVRAVELEGADQFAQLPMLEVACELFPREAGLQRALARARARARARASAPPGA